ncbi:holo-ACP synthase [Salisediminibacterium beveridgei]|uniref:Holo-[acyl-carrier-protein] synthase n=1 Tax=Salisediminibacterium beveridgei TaxID=632773 RepID=A0A1D7QYR3_9BACI|nr:holo-ACP synthase [Salisediminibacterium beveridgei]AOM84140.1 Holo-[acyl-carrier protein] synthase [Salisediminibacterium beveridgei]
MIIGIGLDIVEIERVGKLLERQPRFHQRVLTDREQEKMATLPTAKRRLEYLAGRYAVKEAFAKAKGSGIGKALSFQDIETRNLSGGQPTITSRMLGDDEAAFASITHSAQVAAAQVIIEKVGR